MSDEAVSVVKWVLRLEGLCVLVAAMIFYHRNHYSWGVFALFFLVPDVSLFAYFAGKQFGAVIYNLAHSYIGAVICLLMGILFSLSYLICAGLIWIAHIGFDRALGYGLKYSQGFTYTHLGRIGMSGPS